MNSHLLTHSTFRKWCTAALSHFTSCIHLNAQNICNKTHAHALIFNTACWVRSAPNALDSQLICCCWGGVEIVKKEEWREREQREETLTFLSFHWISSLWWTICQRFNFLLSNYPCQEPHAHTHTHPEIDILRPVHTMMNVCHENVGP